MADHRQKSHAILLRPAGKTPITLELFDAALWPNQPYDDGLYRVRIGDKWHCPTGRYSFLTLAAVGELVATLLAGGTPPQADPAPHLPAKADVRAYLDDLTPFATGWVYVPPHREADGRWYVWLYLYGHGRRKVPCNDVTLVRER